MTDPVSTDPSLAIGQLLGKYIVWSIVTHPFIGGLINIAIIVLVFDDRSRRKLIRFLQRYIKWFLGWTLMWPSYYFVWGVKKGTYWELKNPHTYWSAPEYEHCIVEVLRYTAPATVRVKFLHATWKGKTKKIEEEIAVDLSRTKGKRKLTETEATIWSL